MTNDCGVSKTSKIIGSKWTIMILHQLCDGLKRFGELQRLLPGISPKTLSQRLKELEKHGVVSKKVFDEMPLRVEYSLTEKGASLKKVISQMEEWGKSRV